MVAALPGLALAVTGAAVAVGAGRLWASVPPLMVAIALGALLANVPGALPESAQCGLRIAGRHVLRFGIVLLGFRLVPSDVLELGAARLVLVAAIVGGTFFGTRSLGRRFGVGHDLAVLTAVGFAICGASAVAAASGAIDAEEDDVAVSIVLVTLYGTLAVVVLPLVGRWLHLPDEQFGTWVGASVHDVGQVVAAASTAGPDALHTAIVVKLSRIILLAPVITGLGVAHRRSGADGARVSAGSRRPPLVPPFVLGFLAAAAIRSTGVLQPTWVDGIKLLETWTLCAALVGLGAGVRLAALRRITLRPVLVGLVAWALVAGLSLAGGLAVT